MRKKRRNKIIEEAMQKPEIPVPVLDPPLPEPNPDDVPHMSDRMVIVEALMLQSVSDREIQFDLSKRWSLTERQIRTYIARVRLEWDGKTFNPRVERARIYESLQAKYLQAGAAKDIRAAVHILREQAKLVGAYAPQVIEHSGPGGGPIVSVRADLSKLSDAQLDQLEEMARLAGVKPASESKPPGDG